jgi:hypothetical protein
MRLIEVGIEMETEIVNSIKYAKDIQEAYRLYFSVAIQTGMSKRYNFEWNGISVSDDILTRLNMKYPARSYNSNWHGTTYTALNSGSRQHQLILEDDDDIYAVVIADDTKLINKKLTKFLAESDFRYAHVYIVNDMDRTPFEVYHKIFGDDRIFYLSEMDAPPPPVKAPRDPAAKRKTGLFYIDHTEYEGIWKKEPGIYKATHYGVVDSRLSHKEIRKFATLFDIKVLSITKGNVDRFRKAGWVEVGQYCEDNMDQVFDKVGVTSPYDLYDYMNKDKLNGKIYGKIDLIEEVGKRFKDPTIQHIVNLVNQAGIERDRSIKINNLVSRDIIEKWLAAQSASAMNQGKINYFEIKEFIKSLEFLKIVNGYQYKHNRTQSFFKYLAVDVDEYIKNH